MEYWGGMCFELQYIKTFLRNVGKEVDESSTKTLKYLHTFRGVESKIQRHAVFVSKVEAFHCTFAG